MNLFTRQERAQQQADSILAELKSLHSLQVELARHQQHTTTSTQSVHQELSSQRMELSGLQSYLADAVGESKKNFERVDSDLRQIDSALKEENVFLYKLQAAQETALKCQSSDASRISGQLSTELIAIRETCASFGNRLQEMESAITRLQAEIEAYHTSTEIRRQENEAASKNRTEDLQNILREFSYQLDDLSDSPHAQTSQSEQPQRRLCVHFFFQMPEVWTTWESVWIACLQANEIEPTIVLLPFQHGSHHPSNRERNFLAKHGIPFIDASAYQIEREAPDLVFLQNPYDSTRPPHLSMSELTSRHIKVAYIPYGLDVGGGNDNLRWQYDLEVQRYAWRIFVRSAQHQKMYGMHCQSGNRHVVVTGHPKIDLLTQPSRIESSRDSERQRRNILWSPHFSLEPGGWSTFLTLYEDVLSYFERLPPRISLTIRPHPLFFGRLQEAVPEASAFEERLRKRILQAELINLDETEQYIQTFNTSDALMADAGSFLLEYLPTKKPILYLHNPHGPGLNESGGFVSNYYQAETFEKVKAFLEMVQRNEDPKSEQRLKEISELLYCPDGKSGERIVEYIISNMPRKKAKTIPRRSLK